ncbi:cutinase family protein [Aeromicrobium sp.]|uniref:cutinase family protein n=1 Tax=Aeromicrobium sp. TaxID=1871063 RepID=UPI0030BDFAFC
MTRPRSAHLAATIALMLTTACSGSSAGRADARADRPLLVDTPCADLVVLGLRGSLQSATGNRGAGREVLASVEAMSAQLRRDSGTTVRLEGIPYRAESAAISADYQASVDDGRRKAGARLSEMAGSCPRARFGIVGFSQGAQAAHELAVQLPAGLSGRVVLVAMIADPRRNPADTIASWTYGTASPGPGTLGPGPALGPSLRNSAITFCAEGDEICDRLPGGYVGPLSATHRHFYETPAHAQSTGRHMAKVVRRGGL